MSPPPPPKPASKPAPKPAPKREGSLLETLRAQSDALRGSATAAKRAPEELLRDLDRKMSRSFKWLDEAVSHLEVIRPVVAHAYRLGDILTIASPQFDNGFLSFRRKALAGYEVVEWIELFYRVALAEPIVLKVAPGGANAIDDRLRAAQIKFQYRTEMDENRVARHGIFSIVAAVTAYVKFVPDYRRQTVEVTLRNVDRFETVALEFAADKFDEAALEDLVRLILGEDNAFLRRAPLVGVGAKKASSAANEVATTYRV